MSTRAAAAMKGCCRTRYQTEALCDDNMELSRSRAAQGTGRRASPSFNGHLSSAWHKYLLCHHSNGTLSSGIIFGGIVVRLSVFTCRFRTQIHLCGHNVTQRLYTICVVGNHKSVGIHERTISSSPVASSFEVQSYAKSMPMLCGVTNH